MIYELWGIYMTAVVEVKGLQKHFHKFQALTDVTLTVNTQKPAC